MTRPRERVRAHLANAVTLLALVPLVVAFLPGGTEALPAMLLLADFIDSLDGVVARRLDRVSEFGAQLDRMCDALVHGGLVIAVALQLPGGWGLCSLPPLIAIAIRLTRQATGREKRVGSSTNELLRHTMIALLLVEQGAVTSAVVPVVFAAHTITMLWGRPMPYLVRSRVRGLAGVCVFYCALAAPLLWGRLAAPIGALLGISFVASVAVSWTRGRARRCC